MVVWWEWKEDDQSDEIMKKMIIMKTKRIDRIVCLFFLESELVVWWEWKEDYKSDEIMKKMIIMKNKRIGRLFWLIFENLNRLFCLWIVSALPRCRPSVISWFVTHFLKTLNCREMVGRPAARRSRESVAEGGTTKEKRNDRLFRLFVLKESKDRIVCLDRCENKIIIVMKM